MKFLLVGKIDIRFCAVRMIHGCLIHFRCMRESSEQLAPYLSFMWSVLLGKLNLNLYNNDFIIIVLIQVALVRSGVVWLAIQSK